MCGYAFSGDGKSYKTVNIEIQSGNSVYIPVIVMHTGLRNTMYYTAIHGVNTSCTKSELTTYLIPFCWGTLT